jgi:hypothetical protein
MATHEIKASDLTWPDVVFESPEEAFTYATKLEKELENPDLTDAQREAIDERLGDLFATLFDLN